MTHRLVANSFCENPNNYSIVDHIDRDKHNNNYTNLRWVSNKKNIENSERQNFTVRQYLNGEVDSSWIPSLEEGYYVNKHGQILNIKTKCLLQGTLRNGYIRLSLPSGSKTAHIIIWEVFYGKIPEGKVIDHIDGNRSNNAINNLRLVDQSENMQNSQLNGHKGQVKISQYSLDGKFIKQYSSIREASNNVSSSEYAIKEAANRFGSSGGYFWIREDQNITIEELLKITSTNKPKKLLLELAK